MMRRCDRSMKTTKAISAKANKAMITIAPPPTPAPVRPWSRRPAIARGNSATMPAKMISETPLPTPRDERTFPRSVFLQNFVLPNVFFHVTATYLNLRNMGVDVGKMDFLAAPDA